MNLKNVKYINEFRRLPYPKNEMLIVGSSTMALVGLKKNKDIDLWVTDRVFKRLYKDKNFILMKSKKDGNDIFKSKSGNIEAFRTFPGADEKETVYDQLKKAIVLYGIHFQSPQDVLRWKRIVHRPKDLKDIKMLEKYLGESLVEKYLETLGELT